MTVEEVEKRLSWSSGRATDALETLLDVSFYCSLLLYFPVAFRNFTPVPMYFYRPSQTLLGIAGRSCYDWWRPQRWQTSVLVPLCIFYLLLCWSWNSLRFYTLSTGIIINFFLWYCSKLILMNNRKVFDLIWTQVRAFFFPILAFRCCRTPACFVSVAAVHGKWPKKVTVAKVLSIEIKIWTYYSHICTPFFSF